MRYDRARAAVRRRNASDTAHSQTRASSERDRVYFEFFQDLDDD